MGRLATKLKLLEQMAKERGLRIEAPEYGLLYVDQTTHYVKGEYDLPIGKVFQPIMVADNRYIIAYGGRGSGKSWAFAYKLVLRMLARPDTRCLCVREIQKSISQSVKRLIEDVIKMLGVGCYFNITNTYISTSQGGRVDFVGLQDHTADSMKSYEGVNVAWVEEAQTISQSSLSTLLPTIRMEGSQLWFSFNPKYAEDAVDKLFRCNVTGSRGKQMLPPSDMTIVKANYTDNPFVSKDLLLAAKEDKVRDMDQYVHVWEGDYLTISEATIFKRWVEKEFNLQEVSMLPTTIGLDFGYSTDPMALVVLHVDKRTRTLYVSHEGYERGIDIDQYQRWLSGVIPVQYARVKIVADSASPAQINHIKRCQYNIAGSKKGKGSVDMGINFLKSYDMVIHPRCVNIIKEVSRYSYKVTKQGVITDRPQDTDNHAIDAMRYALEAYSRPPSILSVM